jgi:hypothetical protein
MQGERTPPEGFQGMTLGAYLHQDEIDLLDRLREHWGVKRNTALRRAVRFAAAELLGADSG